jgi:hypothetical protein
MVDALKPSRYRKAIGAFVGTVTAQVAALGGDLSVLAREDIAQLGAWGAGVGALVYVLENKAGAVKSQAAEFVDELKSRLSG